MVTSSRSGIANLETVLGRPFEELLREWAVAEGMRGIEDGVEADQVVRRESVTAGADAIEWTAASTSCRFFQVEASSASMKAVEIEVSAEAGRGVSLTLVRLPAGSIKAAPSDRGRGLQRSAVERGCREWAVGRGRRGSFHCRVGRRGRGVARWRRRLGGWRGRARAVGGVRFCRSEAGKNGRHRGGCVVCRRGEPSIRPTSGRRSGRGRWRRKALASESGR